MVKKRNIQDLLLDPEPPDDDDEETRNEVFEILFEAGQKVKDLGGASPEEKVLYAAFLKTKGLTAPE